MWTQNDGYRAIEKRSGGLCECNGIGVPGCGQQAWIHHHIAGRKVDDPHNPDNLLYLTDPTAAEAAFTAAARLAQPDQLDIFAAALLGEEEP